MMSNRKPVFNKTGDRVEWSRHTWSPVTGCLNACKYCYAKDIAKRFYDDPGSGEAEVNYKLISDLDHQKFPRGPFEPRFWPERLVAPFNTKVPKSTDIRDRSVFVCSMADLFGPWIPQKWIDMVMHVVGMAKQWNFIFLTKNPERLLTIEWPRNAWVGATADTQERAERALLAFGGWGRGLRTGRGVGIRPTKLFLSCEPLLEGIDLYAGEWEELALSDLIDWIIIGGQSRTSAVPEFQPDWEWVEKILVDGHQEGLPVYFKPNLTVRPREYPR